jgi:hypothetical protein
MAMNARWLDLWSDRMNPRGAVVATLMLALCVPFSVAAASDPDREEKGNPDFVPVKTLAGSTGGELVGQWWAQVLAIPAAENPLLPPSPARCLRLGRRGKVAAMAGTSRSAPLTCTIKAGTPLFVAAGLSECSSAEPEPYRAVTEAEQRECAIEFFSSTVVVATLLSLDGGSPVDIHTERFQLVSPQTPVVFPEGAIFDAEAGPATFVGTAYAATTRRRLHAGRHTLTIEFVRADGTSSVTTRTLDIVRGRDDDEPRR